MARMVSIYWGTILYFFWIRF